MPAVTYDIVIEAGATYSVSFEWREDDGSDPPTGPLIDTTNYDAYMQIRTKVGGTVLGDYGPSNGLTVNDGTIMLRIGADDTEALAAGALSGRYDLELHNRTDETDVVRLVQGKVTISPDITKDDPP